MHCKYNNYFLFQNNKPTGGGKPNGSARGGSAKAPSAKTGSNMSTAGGKGTTAKVGF